MKTFLENLADDHRAAEAEMARVRESMRIEEGVRQILEHNYHWETADPYQAVRPGLGSAANDLFHPGGLGMHAARPGSRQHGDLPPFYRTEMQHWHFVDAARVLEAVSPTAVNVLDTLTQFAIFTGFVYTVVPRKGGSQKLADVGQKVLDDWRNFNRWYSWECEEFRRSRRDGEGFLILEPDEVMGFYRLRSAEPEQVKQPIDTRHVNGELGIRSNTSWKYGILTSKEDTSVPIGYWIISQYAEKQLLGTYYRADEIFHLRTEWVDRQAKRGVSDFFSIANDIASTKKLLRNLREGAAVQAAIVWIREHPEGMVPNRLGSTNPANVTRTGQRTESVTYDGSTMLDMPHGMKYIPGPISASGKADVLVKVLQAALRNIGIRWQMPEGMISGDASNANMASALVAEGPFVRAMQCRQWHYREAYKSLMERVLDHAATIGMLGPARENILEEIEVSVEMPPVLARKPKEETERNAVLNERGILSRKSWTGREDLNHEIEQENIAAEPPAVLPGAGGGNGSDPPDTPDDISITQAERNV